MSDRTAVDPFLFVLRGDCERSLHDVCAATGSALADLRRLNPPLRRLSAAAPLPAGAAVRLAPSLAHRGAPRGGRFALGAAEERLRALEARLDALAAAEEARDLPRPPARRVASRTERIAAAVRAEAARQLERIRAEHAEGGKRAGQLQFLVDVAPIAQVCAQVEAEFDGDRLGLRALSAGALEKEKEKEKEKELRETNSRAADRTHADTSEDFCVVPHTHCWEFAVLAPDSARDVQNVWTVLACQSLGALLDAIECRNCIPVNSSKNAFLFVGGTFYIDDRHSEDPDFEDLTIPIRNFDPCTGDVGASPNVAFGACPVRYVSQTTFADLNVRMGEFCLLRHLGWCNHYFYLRSVNSLQGSTRREKSDYPHCVMKAPSRAVRCRMCQQFPATVACYDDDMSPDNPCHYCEPCFTLLHTNDEGIVDEGDFLVVKLPDGKYFTV